MSTDMVQRTPGDQLAARIREPLFKEQIQAALPATVTPEKFVRVAATAAMTNPDLAKLDHTSVLRAMVRAAVDGLMPDGKEAAIVGRGGQAVYQPMIGGFRKIAADFGWEIKTRAVYAGDRFEWVEEPPSVLHQPVRPGGVRGALVGAYAIGRHVDGRRTQLFMPWEDIAKRRDVATTKAVWDRWPQEMAEKTVGRAIFAELPLAEADRERLARVFDATQIDAQEASEALYGPAFPTSPPARQIAAQSSSLPTGEQQGGGSQQADGTGQSPQTPPVPSAPGEDDEPSIGGDHPALNADEQAAIQAAANDAAMFELPSGKHAGKTLGEIAAIEGSDGWFLYGLRKTDLNPTVSQNVWAFARVYKPDLFQQVLAEREAAAA